MALFTFAEIIDLVIMILAIGFIFSKIFRRPQTKRGHYDPLKHYSQRNDPFEDLKWGVIVAAPAVVFHEFAHKFVAMSFGATAILEAPIFMYAIVILLIYLKSPIIFFVGGYVRHTALPPLESALVSFAGPLTNLLLWLLIEISLRYKLGFTRGRVETFTMMKKINMFLFIFNMIPIPGFDGFGVISGLFKYFGGLL